MAARATVEVALAMVVDPAKITAILIDRAGVEQRRLHVRTPLASGAAAVVDAITTTAAKITTARRFRVLGAGVVVPGIVDAEDGIARHSAQIGWHNVPLAELVAAVVCVPVTLDHAVRAAAVAEGERGAGRGQRNWLYVRAGETIDAAAVVNGELQRGATGAAGEFGHLPVYPFGEVCTCGQRGCVEAYASTRVIEQRYARVGSRARTVHEIAALVGREPLADEVWGHAAGALGLALTAYTMVADPEVIVLAGELAGVDEIAVSSLRSELRSRLAWRQAPKITRAEVGDEAALLGAASFGWSNAPS